ncbi:hypothetical protein SRM1_02179 [Pseudomonas fluorescens]|nr:hypothetical protein SRM1_02179 [Pseudomonas fluorescens]
MRGDIQFRRAHIRTAQQQVGRYVLQHGAIHQRNQPRLFGEQRRAAGRLANQHRQRIARAQQLIFKCRDAAKRAKVLGFRLLQIEFSALAAVEEFFGDLEITLLLDSVFPRDAQPRFSGAQGKIGVGDLCAQQYEGVFVVGLRGEILRIG